MKVLFHIFSLGEAQTPVALSVQSTRKAPKNPAKRVFLVYYKVCKYVVGNQKFTMDNTAILWENDFTALLQSSL